MKYVGIDIGGVYIKSATITEDNGKITDIKTIRNPFNFRINCAKLNESLKEELNKHINSDEIDTIGITITAETVGIFKTIKEGVIKIAQICSDTFTGYNVVFLSVDGKVHKYADVLDKPLNFASANWVATSNIATKYIENGFFIDIGSTTTDIIPVVNSKISPNGTTDMKRLLTGELIYSGLLRTYISCIVNKLPYRGEWVGLAAEIRCFTAHVYVLLGLIDELEMLHPYSGKKISITKANAKEAIARSVCADSTLISDEDVICMAQYIYDEQVNNVIKSLKKLKANNWSDNHKLSFVVTGSGLSIAKKAISKLGFNIADTDSYFISEKENSTAVALAFYITQKCNYNN